MQKQKQNQAVIKRKNNLKKGKITTKKNPKTSKKKEKRKEKTYVFQMELLDKIAERTQASILANISNSTSIQFTSETA